MLTLRSSVHDNFRNEAKQEELEQGSGELEACPIVTVFQNLQTVTVKLDVAGKVHIMESNHRDLVASSVLCLVFLLLECQIVLHWASWVSGLLIFAGRELRVEEPEGNEERNRGEEGKEDGSLQSTANLPCGIVWDTTENGEEGDVGETLSAGGICWKRSILDRWVLLNLLADAN
jgi:hypothetical protein